VPSSPILDAGDVEAQLGGPSLLAEAGRPL